MNFNETPTAYTSTVFGGMLLIRVWHDDGRNGYPVGWKVSLRGVGRKWRAICRTAYATAEEAQAAAPDLLAGFVNRVFRKEALNPEAAGEDIEEEAVEGAS